jgi:CubicO group peptidase (beta-lactamase class C family)
MKIAPKEAGLSPERLERITEHLDRNYIAPRKIAGCQALVARHGHVAYFRSLGNMDLERARPMADDTIFRIYSMTKPITSVALMMLFEQGHFQLNDPVYKFIPEWRHHRVWVSGEGDAMETREPARPMTMRHVLSHTGGLTYGMTRHPVDRVYQEQGINRKPGETLRSFIEKLARVPLRYDPGDRWMYSFSTDVCAYLVEAISGKRFDTFLQEMLFGPLGMPDTSFTVAPANAHRLSANYQRQPDKTIALVDGPERSTYLKQPTFLSGGGGLTSTTADYLRFCEMLRRGGELDGTRVLGKRTIELMTKNHLSGNRTLTDMAIGAFSETAYEGIGFGLGFATTLSEVVSGSLGQGDFYWGGAASTIFWVDPREDLVVIFMTQVMPSATFNFRGQLKNIVYSSIVD